MLRSVTVLFVVFAAVPANLAQTRTWTDNTGKFRVQADFVDLADGEIWLRKVDGSVIVVPLNRLSETDRRHVQSLSGSPRDATKATAEPEAAGKKAPIRRTNTAQRISSRDAIERAIGDRTNLPQGQISLTELISQLADHHQIAILLDTRALEDQGIWPKANVTIRDQAATLEEILIGSLKPLRLTWTVDRDVLVITTQEGAESHLEPVVYRVLKPLNVDVLLQDIGTKIAPQSWDKVGGPGSQVGWPGGAVVIAQTSAIHRQIATQYAGVLGRIFPPAAKPSPRKAAKAVAALTAPVTCQFVAMPLDQILVDLSKQSGVSLTLDARALSDVGVGGDTPVTFALQGACLESSLTWLLRPLGFVWTPNKAGLKVTTPEQEAASLLVTTYDVRDLLMTVGGSGDALVDLISSVIAPATWRSVGGPASIEPVAGGLQIHQTYRIHRQIEDLLAALRQASRQ